MPSKFGILSRLDLVVTAVLTAVVFLLALGLFIHFRHHKLPAASLARADALYAGSETTLISPEQKAAATKWFENNQIDVAAFRRLSPIERAKRLTFLTYRFCEPGSAKQKNINSLYVRCLAACGGITYVYRGLAHVLGLKTRYARIYNIPNQGNHVGVEVKTSQDHWGFYDPTFGVFFTKKGTPDEDALSLSQVAAGLKTNELKDHVLQANRDKRVASDAPLSRMFDAAYHHQFMPISNYHSYETISHDNPQEVVMLSVPVVARQSTVELGRFNAKSADELSAGWLDYTNLTLNDANPDNDTSYNASYVSNIREDFVTVFSISNLKAGSYYTLRLRTVNPIAMQQRLQVGAIGRGIRLFVDDVFQLSEGISVVELPFLASSASGQVYVHDMEPTGTLEIFAVQLSPLGDTKALRSETGASMPHTHS